MSTEATIALYNRQRPASLDRIVGNERNVKILENFAKMPSSKRPHCFLFVGDGGCGKTTLAHIMANLCGCLGDNKEEYNSAEMRGIDTIRDIKNRMQRKPTGESQCRAFILEEVHRMTLDAQEALLKPTENCPKHVYFFLTTTNPEKLQGPLKQRMQIINVESLTEENLVKIMKRACKAEGKDIPDQKILQGIASSAVGSARAALSILERVLALPKEDQKKWHEMIEDTQTVAIDLCRLLLRKPKPKWPEVAKVLRTITDQPESVRLNVLGYANAVLLNGNGKAYELILAFKENYFSTGKAGLTASCYEYIFGTD